MQDLEEPIGPAKSTRRQRSWLRQATVLVVLRLQSLALKYTADDIQVGKKINI